MVHYLKAEFPEYWEIQNSNPEKEAYCCCSGMVIEQRLDNENKEDIHETV